MAVLLILLEVQCFGKKPDLLRKTKKRTLGQRREYKEENTKKSRFYTQYKAEIEKQTCTILCHL
jgi:hypothetical protein